MAMTSLTRQDLEDLYRKYGPAVLRRCRAILRNDQDAEEVFQDIFTTVVEKVDTFRGQASITTWLYQITTRACLERLRRTKRRNHLWSKFGWPLSQETIEPNAETATLVHALIGRVSIPLATVALYYYVDGLSHEEIAEIIGCSRRKVGDLLERFHKRAQRLVAQRAPAVESALAEVPNGRRNR